MSKGNDISKRGEVHITFDREGSEVSNVTYDVKKVQPRELAFAISLLFNELSTAEKAGMIEILSAELASSTKALATVAKEAN